MDDAEDADGSLDPRIQIELENLNNATDDINKLETELGEAHTAFRQLLSETTRRLKEIADKLGINCIEKARCYFEALELARLAQLECQKQAQLFQRAGEIHAAAKETVALAEARFTSHQHEWKFDQAWQDMLNHATIKVMDAENQKAECGREHHKKAMLFQDVEKKVLLLEEKYHRYIIKSRPYFEVKVHCDQMLATQKERVQCLQKAIKDAKENYASSLRTLEQISNQIHQQRKDNGTPLYRTIKSVNFYDKSNDFENSFDIFNILANGPREPGVGAELISVKENLNYTLDINKANPVDAIKTILNSEQSKEKHDFKDTNDDKQRVEHLSKRSVDGSETTSCQWELELQASMEKLNYLSLNSPECDRDETIEVNDINKKCREKDSILTEEEIYNTECSRSNLPEDRYPSTDISVQCHKLNLDLHILNKSSSMAYYKGLQSLNSSPIKWTLEKSRDFFKSHMSRSLSNPIDKDHFQKLECSTKSASIDASNYVPNRISEINSKDAKSQSNISNNREIEQDAIDLSAIQNLNDVASRSKNDLNMERTVDYAQSDTDTKLPSELKRCASNGLQVTSYSANSSPIKSKTSLSRTAYSQSSELHADFKDSIFKKICNKSSSIKELPLLALIEAPPFLIKK